MLSFFIVGPLGLVLHATYWFFHQVIHPLFTERRYSANVHNSNEFVGGDKVGGDKVLRDKIAVGNVAGNSTLQLNSPSAVSSQQSTVHQLQSSQDCAHELERLLAISAEQHRELCDLVPELKKSKPRKEEASRLSLVASAALPTIKAISEVAEIASKLLG